MGTINGFKVLANASNQTYENLDVLGTWTGAIVSCADGSHSLHENNVFKRCHLNAAAGAQPKWGFRLYNWKNGTFINVYVENVFWEHPWYLNVIGSLLLRKCRAYNSGAQGLQVVNRNLETYDPLSWMVEGEHRVEQCNFTKVGLPQGDGRRSYVLSFFGKQIEQTAQSAGPRSRWECPVIIQDTIIDNRAEWTPMLRGGVLAEHRPALYILGCDIRHDGIADRPLVKAYKDDLVVIDRSHFVGNKQIDLTDPREVHVTSNTGTVMLRINGVNIGPINQDFHLTP